MQGAQAPARPCILPKVQIDTWGRRSGTGETPVTVLARALLGVSDDTVCMALLKSRGADTVMKIAECVHIVGRALAPKIQDGQVYLRPEWRIRWDDLSPSVRDMVLNVAPHSQEQLAAALDAYYDREAMISRIYSIIGPARSAGVRCCLPLAVRGDR